jgi:hypothetical protein
MDNGVGREKPVRLFVMGDNAWRDEDTWPLMRARSQTFYFSSKAESDRAGTLQNSIPKKNYPPSTLLSDPAHLFTDPYEGYGAHDYRALAGREDVLVFDSDPVSADTEVTGPIRAEIYLSAECRDLDLWVRILDVAPGGAALNLMSPGLDVLRASYRNGSLKPELHEPNSITKLTLDRMLTSNTFLAGHRIRVQISGAFFPHFSRNLQTGESEFISARAQIARIRIYHDAAHASRIVLPVIPR